ncbi:glutathione S-transferase family protein [Aliikangiella sp. IMCC44359]|uniref:glutathione S-transferase family protein n=1 Tax=Aliikangiella sp. IMCC44359 TaxID=3459125 RepID=UPI00403AF6F9
MQLFYTKSSPYANCVRMVITEIGIEGEVELIETHPFDNTDDFIKNNPLGKVPCLLNAGEAIYDSEVICDYLDANITGGTLFNPIYADWRLKTLYSLCSGLMDTCVARRIEQVREQEGIKSEFWWERYNQAISRSLAEIQEKLALFPEEFSILHINLLSCLAYLDFRHKDIDWRKLYPKISRFFDLFKQRECFENNSLTA